MDFEPYTVFKRLDQMNTGQIGAAHFMLIMKQNGYRTLTMMDYHKMLSFFNISNKKDNSINFEEFL